MVYTTGGLVAESRELKWGCDADDCEETVVAAAALAEGWIMLLDKHICSTHAGVIGHG